MNNKNIDYLTKHYNEFIYPRPIEDIDKECYITISPGTSYKIDENLLNISDVEGENYQFNFSLKEKDYKILELVLKGKEKISTILNLYNSHEKNLLGEFFLFLLENSFVDKSLYPVKDLSS